MRIIHTADWHLCNRLGPVDRTADLQARVEEVAVICEAQGADVLLIAGDLFDDRAEPDKIHAAFTQICKTFDTFFKRGGTILAVTGNHDRDAKINMVRSGMMLASPFARSAEGLIGNGRMYLNNGRGFASLAGPDGRLVQFVFAPYPFPSRYDLANADILAKEQLHNALHANVADWLGRVHTLTGFDATLPTVLVGHLNVRGAEVHSLYKINAADDVQFDYADLNPNWAYVALGHIHKPQMVNGECHVRYPGSLDRLDLTESHEHGVICFDIGTSGREGDPQWLPLSSTPFHAITIADLDVELPGIADRFPDRERAIVKIEVTAHGHEMSRDEATRQLRKIFPRLHELNWLRAERPDEPVAGPRVNVKETVETAVRGYLSELDELQADPDKDELLKLVESFLKDGAA